MIINYNWFRENIIQRGIYWNEFSPFFFILRQSFIFFAFLYFFIIFSWQVIEVYEYAFITSQERYLQPVPFFFPLWNVGREIRPFRREKWCTVSLICKTYPYWLSLIKESVGPTPLDIAYFDRMWFLSLWELLLRPPLLAMQKFWHFLY